MLDLIRSPIWKSDLASFEGMVETFCGGGRLPEVIQVLARLRLRIRRLQIDLESIQEALALGASCNPHGGARFISSSRWPTPSAEFDLSKRHSPCLPITLSAERRQRKAVKSLLNDVVEETRKIPQRRSILDYNHVSKRAERGPVCKWPRGWRCSISPGNII